jgi:hypothetical protein
MKEQREKEPQRQVTTSRPTLQDALNVIASDEDIVFIGDVRKGLIDRGFVRLSAGTFYNTFPKDSEDYIAILDALENNRTGAKRFIRCKWRKSDNATALIALYKLLATEEERQRLNSTQAEISLKGEQTIELKID